MRSSIGFLTGSILSFLIGIGAGLLVPVSYLISIMLSYRFAINFNWWYPPSTDRSFVTLYVLALLFTTLVAILKLAQDNRELYEIEADEDSLFDWLLIKAIAKYNLSVSIAETAILIIGHCISASVRANHPILSWVLFLTTFILATWVAVTTRVHFYRSLGTEPPRTQDTRF